MQQSTGRPAVRERREEGRRQNASFDTQDNSFRERRLTGEPAKFNTRSEQRRISWENDLYERQSAWTNRHKAYLRGERSPLKKYKMNNNQNNKPSEADRDAKSEALAKEVPPEQSDDLFTDRSAIDVSSPEPSGNDNPENKVATSLDNE